MHINSDRKLRELILYIAKRSEGHAYFSATKLNKILFYSDFRAFAELGESITGTEYQCEEFGPVPSMGLPAIESLKVEERLAEHIQKLRVGNKRIFIALDEPDLSQFSPEQISLVNEVIEALQGYNANEVSDLSHRFEGWRQADRGQRIPYEMVFEVNTDLPADVLAQLASIA